MGLASSGLAWAKNVEWITNNHPEYQCCFFDNRGVGRSDVPKGRYTTSMMAKDALDLSENLGWNRYHLVGISMGGMISQELALLASDKIISLCLGVTHSGGPGSFPPLSGSLAILKNISKKTIEERAPGTAEVLFSPKFLETVNESGKTNRELQIERIIEIGKQLPPPNPAGLRSQILAVQTHSIGKRRLEMLKIRKFPILIIVATEDMLVNPKASYFLNDALKAEEFIVFKGSGHGINMERFDDYNTAIVRNFQAGFDKLSSQSDSALNISHHQHPLDENNNNNVEYEHHKEFDEVDLRRVEEKMPLSAPQLEN